MSAQTDTKNVFYDPLGTENVYGQCDENGESASNAPQHAQKSSYNMNVCKV